MRDHTKLDSFHLADQVAVATYMVTKSFPREEQFGITSQLRRAAVSAPSNIVEGSARSSEADYVRFLEYAYGSLKELNYQFSLAMRLGLGDPEEIADHRALITRAEKALGALLRFLRNKN